MWLVCAKISLCYIGFARHVAVFGGIVRRISFANSENFGKSQCKHPHHNSLWQELDATSTNLTFKSHVCPKFCGSLFAKIFKALLAPPHWTEPTYIFKWKSVAEEYHQPIYKYLLFGRQHFLQNNSDTLSVSSFLDHTDEQSLFITWLA